MIRVKFFEELDNAANTFNTLSCSAKRNPVQPETAKLSMRDEQRTLRWRYTFFVLLLLLGACQRFPEIKGNPNAKLEFSLCREALAEAPEHRAYQGYNGWFFFTLDLKETYPFYQQTDFLSELSTRLEAKGTTLVMMPITGRALVRPELLYLGDPAQINFDPDQAEKAYDTFLGTLSASGAEVFDTLGAARAYDASGGLSFFRRDLHWRSEGAKVMFEGIAAQVKQIAPELPKLDVTLQRSPNDDRHYGQFVNNWTKRNCGYRLPGELQGVYTVTPAAAENASAEVVLVGSSFSLPPYGYDFLEAALQSRVLNAAVGSGGAFVSLERYLRSETYQAHRPKVLVWEFPLYAPEFTPSEQDEVLRLVR